MRLFPDLNLTLGAQVLSQPERQRDEHKSGVSVATGGKYGGSGDVQVLDSMDSAVGVHHP